MPQGGRRGKYNSMRYGIGVIMVRAISGLYTNDYTQFPRQSRSFHQLPTHNNFCYWGFYRCFLESDLFHVIRFYRNFVLFKQPHVADKRPNIIQEAERTGRK